MSILIHMSMHGHLVDVIAGRFSADGVRILSAGSDGIVKLWDAGTAITISAISGSGVAALA
jgi:WD40 repeat protein